MDSQHLINIGVPRDRPLQSWWQPWNITLSMFWSDKDPNKPQIWRLQDRMFIGAAAGYSDTRSNPSGGWIPNTAYGANWAIRDSQFGVMAARGCMAVTGMSQTKDGDAVSMSSPPSAIGLSGFVICNSTRSVLNTGWAGYLDVQFESGLAGYGLEVAVKNKSGVNSINTPDDGGVSGASGVRCVGGGDPTYGGVSTNPSNAAYTVEANSNTWNTGILIFSNSLTKSDAGFSQAIKMGLKAKVSWYTGMGVEGFMITSQVVTASRTISLQALDNELDLLNQSGQAMFKVRNVDGAVNYPLVVSGVSGTNPILQVGGTDTNVGLTITMKGTGTINLKLPTSSAGLNSGDWWSNNGVVTIVP